MSTNLEPTGTSEIRYLQPIAIDSSVSKKYCRFKKYGIKHIDYKDPDYLLRFVNEQGKILPRRLTGTSLKYQPNWLKLLSAPVTSPSCPT